MKNSLFRFIWLALMVGCAQEEVNVCSEKCDLVPEPGPCDAMIKKYYFDSKERECKEFIWGGCGGVVPFQTIEECQACRSTK